MENPKQNFIFNFCAYDVSDGRYTAFASGFLRMKNVMQRVR